MNVKELIRLCSEKDRDAVYLNQEHFEKLEDEWREFLEDVYGKDDIRRLPATREGIEQVHFLVKGKPIIMEQF